MSPSPSLPKLWGMMRDVMLKDDFEHEQIINRGRKIGIYMPYQGIFGIQTYLETGMLLFHVFSTLVITKNKACCFLPSQLSLQARGNAGIYNSNPQLKFSPCFAGEQKVKERKRNSKIRCAFSHVISLNTFKFCHRFLLHSSSISV